MELTKLLMSDHPELINDACELGITKVILPEWDAMVGVHQNIRHHIFDVDRHTLQALKNIRADIGVAVYDPVPRYGQAVYEDYR